MLVDSQQPAECTGCTQHVPDTCEHLGTSFVASQRDKEGHVPDVPDVPDTYTHIQAESQHEGTEQTASMNACPPGTPGTPGTEGTIPQQQAKPDVPDIRCTAGTWGNYPVQNPPEASTEAMRPSYRKNDTAWQRHQECDQLASAIEQMAGRPAASLRGSTVAGYADDELSALHKRMKAEWNAVQRKYNSTQQHSQKEGTE
jgi:hypothetical protein